MSAKYSDAHHAAFCQRITASALDHPPVRPLTPQTGYICAAEMYKSVSLNPIVPGPDGSLVAYVVVRT